LHDHELVVVPEAVEPAVVATAVGSREDAAARRCRIAVAQGRNCGFLAGQGSPGGLGIGRLHRRDDASALEDLEPGGLQHALGDAGSGDVVRSFSC
jgi:hypothetical protein